MMVYDDWNIIQKLFTAQVGSTRKDLLKNLKDIEFPGLQNYAPGLKVERKVTYESATQMFIIDVKLNNTMGTKITVWFVKGELVIRVGDLYSYRKNMENLCCLNEATVFKCTNSSKTEDLQNNIDEKFMKFTDFIRL